VCDEKIAETDKDIKKYKDRDISETEDKIIDKVYLRCMVYMLRERPEISKRYSREHSKNKCRN